MIPIRGVLRPCGDERDDDRARNARHRRRPRAAANGHRYKVAEPNEALIISGLRAHHGFEGDAAGLGFKIDRRRQGRVGHPGAAEGESPLTRRSEHGRRRQRAKDKTEGLQARAGALDELVASGALDAPGDSSALDHELAALFSANEVETELARLKAAVPPPALDGPPAAG